MNLFRYNRIFLLIAWLCCVTIPAFATGIEVGLIVAALISSAVSVGVGILAQLLAPKPKPVENGKSDPRVQTSDYGTFLPRVRGTMGQVAGQIIDAFPYDANGKFGREVRSVIPGNGGKRKTPDTINYIYYGSIAVLLTDNEIQGITKIILDTEVFYIGSATGMEVTASPAGCAGIHIVLGTESQLPDSTFEAYHGVDTVPAYRGCAVLYIYDLDLTKYYNRIPQITCEIVADDGDLETIVTAEMQLAGLTGDDYDLTDLAGIEIDGLYIGQRSSVRQTSLEPIALAKQIDFIEVDGKITAFLRARASEVTIPAEHLGAYDYDQAGQADTEKPFATESTRIQDQDIARGVDITYFDTGRAYEKNTQSFRREIYDSFEQDTITLQLAMDANEANRVAKVRAITNWTEREPFKFTLPPEYVKYTPGTVMTIETLAGREVDVIVETMDIGIPGGMIACQGRAFLVEAYTQTGEGDVGLEGSGTKEGGYESPGGGGDVVTNAVDTLVMFSNLDALIPAYAGLSGFYIFVTPDPADTDPSHVWNGVTIYQDAGGVGTLRAIASQAAQSIFGVAIDTLANGSGIDTTNEIEIELYYGSVESIETEDFDTGRPLNIFVIGEEIIQARDVIQDDPMTYPNRYTLSHLRRGMRGTTGAQSTHGASEEVALLDNTVNFISIPPEDSGDTLNYYAAGLGVDPLDTPAYPYAYGAPDSGLNYVYTSITGDGFTTSFSGVYHGMNTTNISITFDDYTNSPSGYSSDANNVQIDFGTAPSGLVGITITRL